VSSSHDELLKSAIGNDRAALGELLERHGPEVRRRLRGKIPRRWRSLLTYDDVMQQAYFDAMVDIGKFQPRGAGSFIDWLTTLARHNLLDAVEALKAAKRGGKRQRIQPRSEEESLAAFFEQLSSGVSTPSQRAARKEALACLRRAIDQLPQDWRAVVEAYDLKNLPVDEVAGALARTPGSVFMLRKRAHRRLREIMGATSQYFSDHA